MKDILIQVCKQHGWHYQHSQKVSGGDINQAFRFSTEENNFFIKINDAGQYPKMFEREAKALGILRGQTTLKVPVVIAVGESDSFQYLILEWMENGKPVKDFWTQFAVGLAALHRSTNKHFGWPSANYIGSLVQHNSLTTNWSEFYANSRILPMVKVLYNNSVFTSSDLQTAVNFCKHLPDIFPEEPPALLHGDLWSGNFMVGSNGEPVIFDPASYYGHREMDMGMTSLFGGFDSQFYHTYNEVFPLEKNWRKRVAVAQLYPLLVHAVLFGGGYINQCKSILKEWG